MDVVREGERKKIWLGKENRKRLFFAIATALSVVCSSLGTGGMVYAQTAESKEAALGEESDYVFEGNMIRNSGFDEDTAWIFSEGSAGYAYNNGHGGRGDRHF